MVRRYALNVVKSKTLLLIVMTVALLMSMYRDVRNSVVMPSDMRNRMMGGRMMEDGASPYFYIWKEGDTVRYYDTYIPPNSIVSLATSTPFFHYGIQLIADLPQYQLNTIWFFLQYFFLGACLILGLITVPPEQRKKKAFLLAGIAIFFTYTVGWRFHTNTGQNYMLIPVMAMGCYYCLMQKSNGLHLVLFALFACSLVLLRPIAILFFLPFLFYFKHYYKWLCSAAALMVLYIGFVFITPIQKANWIDYFKSVQVHVKNHQKLLPTLKPVPYDPIPIHQVEGVDLNFTENLHWAEALNKETENSNFFIFYNELTGTKISVRAMTIIGIAACTLLLLPLWIAKKRKLSFPPALLLLLGFIIYNTYEFFTPVTRPAYHWVQFVTPVFLMLLFSKRLYLIPIALLISGIYLNIVAWSFVKMEHSIGEGLVIIAMLFLVYRELLVKHVNENWLRLSDAVYIS